jgi:hypothetical protein
VLQDSPEGLDTQGSDCGCLPTKLLKFLSGGHVVMFDGGDVTDDMPWELHLSSLPQRFHKQHLPISRRSCVGRITLWNELPRLSLSSCDAR